MVVVDAFSRYEQYCPKNDNHVFSGKQRINQLANSDLTVHESTGLTSLHSPHDPVYKSQQVLSQQSTSLLQQSKAKHQAMLAQVCLWAFFYLI